MCLLVHYSITCHVIWYLEKYIWEKKTITPLSLKPPKNIICFILFCFCLFECVFGEGSFNPLLKYSFKEYYVLCFLLCVFVWEKGILSPQKHSENIMYCVFCCVCVWEKGVFLYGVRIITSKTFKEY